MTTSAYIHIPFCEHICTYCDFCKRYNYDFIIDKYLNALKKEIIDNYRGESLKTIYIGGGTPSSLNIKELTKLMEIVKLLKLDNTYEFTFECNPENISEEKLILLKKNGVNRISLGVESTIDKYLKYLGRNHDFKMVKEKIKLIKKYFNNINVDLIYALPNETMDELKKDLLDIVNLDVNHVSTYSLEIHNNTILGINKTKPILEDMDSDMYNAICSYLKENGFNHYEISNFCKDDAYSHHNMVYWKNEEYYGFGLGASGYVNNIRYDNTRSMYKYLSGKRLLNTEKLSEKDKISYELILGFRLINGININEFKKKYHKELINQYNIKELIKDGLLVNDGLNIKVNYDKIYVENSILENFVD